MEQIEFLRKVVDAFEDLRIPYCLVGSFASAAYGEPRMTRDIDLVADLGPGEAPRLCAAFPPPEYHVSLQAATDAVLRRGQFNIIHSASANKVDVMVAGRGPWEVEEMARRRRIRLLPDRDCSVAAPEDVVIAKMLSYGEGGSEKHLRDITGILRVSGAIVDRGYVERWATELGLLGIWRAILRRLDG